MNPNGFGTREEEAELRRAIYRETVANGEIRARAWGLANAMRGPEDPAISEADIEASRRYIETVIMRADIVEVQTMTPKQFAASWANGALGAARYRARKAFKSKKRTDVEEG